MEILRQLGLDQTVWIQLGFFGISFLFLWLFLFKPYQRNLKYRKKNTGGALDEAIELASITERLAMDYLGKMKKQNQMAEEIYSQLKAEGAHEEDTLISVARLGASKIIEETRQTISREMLVAQKELRAQIPQVSGLIASRLLGRNL